MSARNRMNKVHSIYHVMDEKGVFEANPANAGSVDKDGLSLYKGPVPYPKMLYHPKGEMEKVVQGIAVTDRDGNPVLDKNGEPKYTGASWAIKHRIVNSEEEENHPDNLGWLASPGEAMRQSPDLAAQAPKKSQQELMQDEIKMLRARLAEQEAKAPTKLPIPHRPGPGTSA